ncbi:hypothetical protein SAMN02745157_0397 [Kaistia soli DSM 19436]|uniref:Transcriptional regulator n=1 Tax=Kaistia soli DSM 19436 TaxID=1122133 RepID=A0A1M4UBB7_9HYPH|nr:hypothetical protein [Kaistia soli]SHE54015.1 hypothetical protein SAMN02745157_0397 [Kaistia soli DSM 19436]
MMPEPSNARLKADAKFDKTQKGVVDASKSQRERTAKLKALRLAKEEEERAAIAAAPPKTRAKRAAKVTA